jgi:hypothetical protein
MGLLEKNEIDLGVCAKLKCPFCMKEGPFALRKIGTSITYHGLSLFEIDKIYQLACTSCKYRKDIEPQEISCAKNAVILFSKKENGEISESEYSRQIVELGFTSLNVLREASKVWVCPNCKEEVPANFSECWKCKAIRPMAQLDEVSEQLGAPKLPYGITRSVHPWEQ